jgi:hypothetical protein
MTASELSDAARVARMPPGPTGLNPYVDNFVRLSRLPAATVSEIRGRARGAGSEFVLATDIRFASEKAILGQRGRYRRRPRRRGYRGSGRSSWKCLPDDISHRCSSYRSANWLITRCPPSTSLYSTLTISGSVASIAALTVLKISAAGQREQGYCQRVDKGRERRRRA